VGRRQHHALIEARLVTGGGTVVRGLLNLIAETMTSHPWLL